MKRFIIGGIHIAYWSLYFILLFVMFLLTKVAASDQTLSFQLGFRMWMRAMLPLAIIPGVIGFYGSYAWLFPRYFVRKEFGKFFMGSMLLLPAIALLSLFTVWLVIPGGSSLSNNTDGLIFVVLLVMVMAAINMAIGTVIRGFVTSYYDIQLKEELARESARLEQELVKAQLSPHFLFNTLNNIDVLIQRDPSRASNYLIKLSEILRYMLYDTKEEMRSLQSEIHHIEKYVELQRIRSSVDNYITLEKKGDISEAIVMPMIYLPFIENAFKYAEHKKIEGAVQIRWEVTNSEIHFFCSNVFSSDMKNHHAKNDGGLGNELMIKRLSLLYPNNHKLQMEEKDERYTVTLELPLH